MRFRVASLLCFLSAAGLSYAAGVYEGLAHHVQPWMIVAAGITAITGTIFLFSGD